MEAVYSLEHALNDTSALKGAPPPNNSKGGFVYGSNVLGWLLFFSIFTGSLESVCYSHHGFYAAFNGFLWQVISLLEYAAEYLASEVITKYNILANVHGEKGHERTLCYPSSLEISELWKAVSSAALLNTVAKGPVMLVSYF